MLNFAFLNSFYQTGLKNLVGRAVLDHVQMAAELRLVDAYRKVDKVSVDIERRRMSVVIAAVVDGHEQRHKIMRKGAVEEVLAACCRFARRPPPIPVWTGAVRFRRCGSTRRCWPAPRR